MFRDLVRKKQALSLEDCLTLLKSERRGVLAVLGDGGYPYAVPMDHWYCEEDGKIYFHGGKSGHKIDAMRACPRVSYCVMDSGTPVEDAWWVRVRSVIVFGRVEFVDDYDRAMEISRQLSYQFTQDETYIADEIRTSGPGTLVFALVPEHITGKIVTER